MHKPDKQMDPVEEVENILKRLAPSAMSERATRANESMIVGLAGSPSAVLKQPAKRQYWWQAGIAASLMAGAGLVYLGQPKVDAGVVGEYEFLEALKSTISTSDEMWVEQADEIPMSEAAYNAEDINVIWDKKNDFVMHIGRREMGKMIANISEF
ncbi:MAG: hypothetical protein K9M60_03910 [Akkermansiaceae bacterium]|nr:hypothetical protein [Akkermansiaceae bacterium]